MTFIICAVIIVGVLIILRICKEDDVSDISNFVISKTKTESTLKPKNDKIYVNGRWLNIDQVDIDDYDNKGNIIHKKSNDTEFWKEYDEQNNCIHIKYSDGKEIWYNHDENGKCIYEKHSDGKECWKEYDYINHIAVCKCTNKKEEFKDYANDANYVIRREYADGYILWKDYDEKNRVIHTVDTKQREIWNEYDVNDNLIHQIVHDENERQEWFGKYNILGLLEQSIVTDSNNYEDEFKFEYFFDGIPYDSNLIQVEKNSNNENAFFKLDENNNKIYIKQIIKYWYKI